MSRKIVPENLSFNRTILAKFMTEDELKEMDRKYNREKLIRLLERATGKKVSRLKSLLEDLTKK